MQQSIIRKTNCVQEQITISTCLWRMRGGIVRQRHPVIGKSFRFVRAFVCAVSDVSSGRKVARSGLCLLFCVQEVVLYHGNMLCLGFSWLLPPNSFSKVSPKRDCQEIFPREFPKRDCQCIFPREISKKCFQECLLREITKRDFQESLPSEIHELRPWCFGSVLSIG